MKLFFEPRSPKERMLKKREMADMPPNSKVCGRFAPELNKIAEMPRFSFFAPIKIKSERTFKLVGRIV